MKSAYEMKHTQSVTAIALFYEGDYAGKIVANWSDNPAGSVCTATMGVWKGPLSYMSGTGKAGGGGYDKLSAAIADALMRAGLHDQCPVGSGAGNQRQKLEELGYMYAEVC